MSGPFAFAFTALEMALKARAGRLTMADRLRLAQAALEPEVDAGGRAAAAAFLAGCRDDAGAAGRGLHAWVSGVYPPPVVPAVEHDWQRRKDLA